MNFNVKGSPAYMTGSFERKADVTPAAGATAQYMHSVGRVSLVRREGP